MVTTQVPLAQVWTSGLRLPVLVWSLGHAVFPLVGPCAQPPTLWSCCLRLVGTLNPVTALVWKVNLVASQTPASPLQLGPSLTLYSLASWGGA